jgi:Bifunctional DNA primase/polymerase, N-terminal
LAAVTTWPTQFAKDKIMKIDNLTLKYARKYTRRGWSVVPIPVKEKAPRLKGWQKLRLNKAGLADYFSEGGNIGVLLGDPSKHLIDIDLDCDEAIVLASTFLPATERIHGRKSKLRSHWYYYGEVGLKAEKFSDLDGTCLLEIRSTGQQTIVPPSTHPSGERVRWAEKGKPSHVTNEMISQSTGKLAAACLLSRHWPSIGSRDEASLALAGLLLRAHWTVEEAQQFISNVALAAHDEEWKDREAVVGSTEEKMSANGLVTGRPRLEKLIGKEVIARVVKWLRIEFSTPGSEKHKRTTDLVAITRDLKLFHTADDCCYAVIEMDGHRETWRLREKHFTNWLAKRYFRESGGSVVSAKDLAAVIDVLEGQARFDGPQRRVYIRVAERRGAIYIDLCDKAWRAIKITSKCWRIVKNPPVRFRRTAGMLPLPVPTSGGSIEELRPFLNVRSEKHFKLIVGWLLSNFNPRGPYPVLLIQGEAGCAKSTASRLLRRLVDPNKCSLRAEPRETRDLMIAAANARCVVFDNISNLRPWLSDSFCRLATGGGFAVRKNYSDDQEMLFESANPILLNGIDGVVSRGDLLDRCIVIYLPVIPDQNRKPEKQFWSDFEKAQGRIFGALLDAVSMALKRLSKVKLAEVPRMADFTKWVTAAEPALGWLQGSFLESYKANRKSANSMALDSSPIVDQLRKLVIRHEFKGTASALLLSLRDLAGDRARDPYFPKYAKALSSHLRRIAPNLRADGFEIEFDIKTPGGNSRKLIRIAYPIS